MAEPVAQEPQALPEGPLAVRARRVARALSAHQHRTAAALFALFVLVYLWPALVGGNVLAPLALLYQAPPWANLKPPDLAHYFNPELLDVTLSYYPWDVLARQMIHAGTFPAWNPYALGGTPFFANPEVGWLSPFSLPLWILPLNYALGLVAAVKLWFAGFGAYLLARELRLGFWPGMLAGVSFALCAFNMEWLGYTAFTAVSVLFPWLLLLAERIVRRGRSADGLLLTATAAVALAAGHPGTELHVLSGTVLYAIVRALSNGELTWAERGRRLALVGGACAVGGLVMAVVLVPAQQAAIGTTGSAARAGGGTEAFHGAHMPIGVLRTALFPEWWGRPSDVGTAGPSVFSERTFYAGVIPLVLALVGLGTWRTSWRRLVPFAVLGALGVAVALELPGLHQLLDHLPLFDRVQNQRMLLWFLLAVALLCAFGLQAVLDAERPARAGVWRAIAAAAVAGLVGLGSIHFRGDTVSRGLHWFVHRVAPVTAEAMALASVLWWLVFVAGLALVLALLRARPRLLSLAGGLVVLLVALDMLHFAHGYQSMGPPSRAIPPRTPAVAFLQRHAAQGRIAGFDFAVANDWSTVYGLRDVRGYDAPQPSMRFYRLWHTIEPEQRLHTAYTFTALEASSLKTLGVLGARWIAAPPGAEERLRGLDPVYRGSDATVYENALALPRALVPARVQAAGSEDDELAAVVAEGFDPRRDAVVRRAQLGGAPPPAAGPGGSARVVAEQNARVTLRATLPRRGVVLLDDAWAPGWSVTVDGRPARALETDMVLRGVVVPAGAHEVVWSYRVPGLRAGALLSGLGLLIMAGWGGWLLTRRRRTRRS